MSVERTFLDIACCVEESKQQYPTVSLPSSNPTLNYSWCVHVFWQQHISGLQRQQTRTESHQECRNTWIHGQDQYSKPTHNLLFLVSEAFKRKINCLKSGISFGIWLSIKTGEQWEMNIAKNKSSNGLMCICKGMLVIPPHSSHQFLRCHQVFPLPTGQMVGTT